MEFVDPRELPYAPVRSRGELPHLHKANGFYFVTFRLADAVKEKSSRKLWMDLKASAMEQLKEFDPPLTLGTCALRNPQIAQLVQDAILHFEAVRYWLIAWTIMPNHVHAVLAPESPFDLKQILHTWKSFTSHRANKMLGRSGSFWERESFDHLIRHEDSLEEFVRYIDENPVLAGLCGKPVEWKFGSAGQGFRSQVWGGFRATECAGETPAPQ